MKSEDKKAIIIEVKGPTEKHSVRLSKEACDLVRELIPLTRNMTFTEGLEKLIVNYKNSEAHARNLLVLMKLRYDIWFAKARMEKLEAKSK